MTVNIGKYLAEDRKNGKNGISMGRTIRVQELLEEAGEKNKAGDLKAQLDFSAGRDLDIKLPDGKTITYPSAELDKVANDRYKALVYIPPTETGDEEKYKERNIGGAKMKLIQELISSPIRTEGKVVWNSAEAYVNYQDAYAQSRKTLAACKGYDDKNAIRSKCESIVPEVNMRDFTTQRGAER